MCLDSNCVITNYLVLTEVRCAAPILQRHKYVILVVHRLRPKVIVMQHSQMSSFFKIRNNVKDEENVYFAIGHLK
jgi:hypothetical protein